MITVKAQNLQPGDELRDGTTVNEVWKDPEGVWLATSDGEAGYVNYDQKFKVERL